jgi:hypothetical protein
VKRASIFLLIVVLVVGMAGCNFGLPGFTPQYAVKISSTTGGSVTTPGEGLFRYPAGTVVNLVAEADRGYEFGAWVTSADTIADVYNATTTITLNRNYYLVTAQFIG